MKKLMLSIALTVSAIFFATAAFAAAGDSSDSSKIWDELIKITEKCTDNASYSMETVSTVSGQKITSKMKFYFRDVKNYRVDTEADGQKTTMVYAGGKAWVYLDAQKVVTNMDPDSIESIDIKGALEKQKETADVSEGKDGANITYTITERETKNKTVFTVDPKKGIYTKMQVYDAAGTLLSEAVYSDWKFEKIGDETFAKPKGAKEMTMPSETARPETK